MSSKHSTAGPVTPGAARPRSVPGPKSRAAKNGGAEAETADRVARIRELAYRFFLERGSGEGHALDDWLQAEAQLVAQEHQGDSALADGR